MVCYILTVPGFTTKRGGMLGFQKKRIMEESIRRNLGFISKYTDYKITTRHRRLSKVVPVVKYLPSLPDVRNTNLCVTLCNVGRGSL
jgi:hypothetical protein